MTKRKVSIMIADDDPDDCKLIKDAMRESLLSNELIFVKDGEELMRSLIESDVLPGLILLDLNMPKKDGREALAEIKSNPRLKQIPVVVLTTSKAEEDIYRSYNLGVNSFISKPVSFSSLVDVMRGLGRYWFELVELPKERPTRTP